MDIGNLDIEVNLEEGQWIGDIPDMEDVRFLVRSTNYKPFRAGGADIARRSGKKTNSGIGIVNFGIKAGKPLADHILLGWEGITKNGKPLKYTKELGIYYLTLDDKFGIGDKFRRAVEWAGDQVAEKLLEQTKEAEGN